MNIRKRMMEQTAGLPSMDDIAVDETPPANEERPKTAVGTMAALSAAQIRIKELEEKGAQTTIHVEKIRRNPWQPRKRFVEEKLQELAENIREVGLMQPILVRRAKVQDGEEQYFELIAGERRLRAHQIIEAAEIKALILDATDADMAVWAMTENINREDLTDYEIARGMIRAEKEFPSRKRMAEGIGINRTALYRYLAFGNLPSFMIDDLDKRPEMFGGNAAHDTVAVFKKFGGSAEQVARELWQQVLSGSLDQTKYAATLESTLNRKDAGHGATPTQRDIHKVYAGKAQAGSITKDAVNFTVKLRSAVLTAVQEERIRKLIDELFDERERT
jgi:ParB family chromosome partitioning protein